MKCFYCKIDIIILYICGIWHFSKAFSSIILYSVFYKAVGLAYYAILRGKMETERLTQSVRKQILECWSLLVGPVDFLEVFFFFFLTWDN